VYARAACDERGPARRRARLIRRGQGADHTEDEAVGFIASECDALAQSDSRPEDRFPAIVSGIYSDTAMLNRLLQRQGLRIGCTVNAGHEDYLRLERGIQT
jgi:N-methylhydantoinase A/oxoprolinase/acetone carboxylase beta subunit